MIRPLDIVVTKDSIYRTTVELDGSDYEIELVWNERDSHWFLTLRDAEGTDLATGVKVTATQPILYHSKIDGLPPGQLWAFDTTQQNIDPGLRDIGSRVIFMYSDEVA